MFLSRHRSAETQCWLHRSSSLSRVEFLIILLPLFSPILEPNLQEKPGIVMPRQIPTIMLELDMGNQKK